MITCVIEGWSQKEKQALWVSWDNGSKEITLNELCFVRPDGVPNQKVPVQVFSCSTPITEVAFYTFHNKSNEFYIEHFAYTMLEKNEEAALTTTVSSDINISDYQTQAAPHNNIDMPDIHPHNIGNEYDNMKSKLLVYVCSDI